MDTVVRIFLDVNNMYILYIPKNPEPSLEED